MKVRNLSYDELNEIEKQIVDNHYKEQIEDEQVNCKNMPCVNSVQEFWEMHKEADTDDGNFDGWAIPKKKCVCEKFRAKGEDVVDSDVACFICGKGADINEEKTMDESIYLAEEEVYPLSDDKYCWLCRAKLDSNGDCLDKECDSHSIKAEEKQEQNREFNSGEKDEMFQ